MCFKGAWLWASLPLVRWQGAQVSVEAPAARAWYTEYNVLSGLSSTLLRPLPFFFVRHRGRSGRALACRRALQRWRLTSRRRSIRDWRISECDSYYWRRHRGLRRLAERCGTCVRAGPFYLIPPCAMSQRELRQGPMFLYFLSDREPLYLGLSVSSPSSPPRAGATRSPMADVNE